MVFTEFMERIPILLLSSMFQPNTLPLLHQKPLHQSLSQNMKNKRLQICK